MKKQLRAFALILTTVQSLVMAGCQLLGGLQVDPVAQTTNKPSQVGVYVSVRDGDDPVPRLEAQNFRIYENDTQLDPAQVQMQLLPRDSVAVHQTLVLVDLSGSIAEAGRLALLEKQLVPFVDRLRMQQNVSVYGFDGGEKLYPFGKFPKADPDASPDRPAFQGMKEHKQADPSSNLNGAILTALAQLDFELNDDARPVKVGRLVIVAKSPDLAGRTSDDRVEERLDQSPHHVFVVGVEKEPNTGYSERIGRSGFTVASSFDNMESQLSELATRIERDYEQYYLISYCSPGRSGERLLLIEVARPDGDGGETVGETEIKFSSDGFGSGCDASTIPRFAPSNRASSGSSKQASVSLGAEPAAAEAPPAPEPEEAPADAEAARAVEAAPEGAAATPEGEGEKVVPPPASPEYAQ